jgi:hypothetical protein
MVPVIVATVALIAPGPCALMAGRTIKRCFEGVLAYFETGYTTSRAEGLNTKARLARQAFGFHSADAVRAMIELRYTGLNIGELHLFCGVMLSKAREGIGST